MEALRTLNFWLLLSMLFLWACCSFIILAHVVRHAIDLGVSTLEAATILTVIGGASIPGRLAMGRLSDTWGSKRVCLISVLILMGAMSWLLWASDLWMLYLFAAFFGLSFGASSPLMAAVIGDAFGTRNLGIILGALQTGWSAGCAFGPVLAGHIYDINGSYTPAFLLGIGISLGAALLIALLRIRGHRNRADA